MKWWEPSQRRRFSASSLFFKKIPRRRFPPEGRVFAILLLQTNSAYWNKLTFRSWNSCFELFDVGHVGQRRNQADPCHQHRLRLCSPYQLKSLSRPSCKKLTSRNDLNLNVGSYDFVHDSIFGVDDGSPEKYWRDQLLLLFQKRVHDCFVWDLKWVLAKRTVREDLCARTIDVTVTYAKTVLDDASTPYKAGSLADKKTL